MVELTGRWRKVERIPLSGQGGDGSPSPDERVEVATIGGGLHAEKEKTRTTEAEKSLGN